MKRRFTLNMFGTLESSGPLETSSKDLTIEALVSVIQEPDKGVPRALTGALEDVKIHRGTIIENIKYFTLYLQVKELFFLVQTL